MSKRATLNPVKTQGKRVRQDARDSKDDVKRAANHKNDLEQGKPQSPPQKRQRIATKSIETPVVAKPMSIVMLEASLETERLMRQNDRRSRLSELLSAIKKQDGFAVAISAQHPAFSLLGSSPIHTSYEPPFPEIRYLLNCPVVLDLYETDRTPERMGAEFERHRAEIEQYIAEWKARIQNHCAKLARQGPKVTELIQSSHMVGSEKSDPYANLSDDLKRLLRADSFFSTTAQFYSKRPMTYGSVLSLEGLLGVSTTFSTVPKEPPNLDSITWHAEANTTARSLLESLGIPDASYLEMTDRAIYTCGRCHDTELKTWQEIVYHYVTEKQRYERIKKDEWIKKQGVTFRNAHDPKRYTDLPLVQYLGTQATNTETELYECNVCAEALLALLGVPEIITSEDKIVQHLSTVHGIARPMMFEHYTLQTTEEPETSGSHSNDWDDISEGEGGCDYARNRHRYRRYGTRRKNHHYRSRCYYDGGGDDEWC